MCSCSRVREPQSCHEGAVGQDSNEAGWESNVTASSSASKWEVTSVTKTFSSLHVKEGESGCSARDTAAKGDDGDTGAAPGEAVTFGVTVA